jgi:hypothetical protein
MLFTDATISTVDHLAEYESEIRTIAVAENIDLETKLRLAQTEVGVELAATDSSFELGRVVVSDALRLWHIFHTLAIVFRDAYNRKLNDKYRPKWTEYHDLAKIAAGQCLAIGVALVFDPLPAPAAPALDAVAGGSLPATTYFVRITWTNAAGQESAPSAAASVSLAVNQLLRITPPAAPAGAAGWYPYVATTADDEQRQVTSALTLGSPWTMPASGLVSGAVPGDGQPPDLLRTVPRTLQRG